MRALRAIPGLIFGLFFAGGGLLVFSETGLPTWQDWYAMQQWQPAQAILISLSGGDNQTQASYRYEVNGIIYQGDRVYVARFNDNIGSYHQDLSNLLLNQRHAGQPIAIWVNPFDPRQSVIDRKMRWGLFALISGFCSIFVFIGLLIAYASISSNKQAAHSERPSLFALRREWKQRLHDPEFHHSFTEFARQKFEQFGQQAEEASEKLTGKRVRDGVLQKFAPRADLVFL